MSQETSKKWAIISSIVGVVAASVLAQVESCQARRRAEAATVRAQQAEVGGKETAGKAAYTSMELQASYKVLTAKIEAMDQNIRALERMLDYNNRRLDLMEDSPRARGYARPSAPDVSVSKLAPLPENTNAAMVQHALGVGPEEN